MFLDQQTVGRMVGPDLRKLMSPGKKYLVWRMYMSTGLLIFPDGDQ